MEFARLQLYIPEFKKLNNKKFILFEHEFWIPAAFIFVLYTAWTLYRIKRPSISLMESITVQKFEEAINEKTGENVEPFIKFDDSLRTLYKAEDSVDVSKALLQQTMTNFLGQLNDKNLMEISKDEKKKNTISNKKTKIDTNKVIETNNDQLASGKSTEEILIVEENGENSDSSSTNSSDSSDGMWSDDCNTVYHLSDNENPNDKLVNEDDF